MTRYESVSRDKHKNASRGKTKSWVREENVGSIEEIERIANDFVPIFAFLFDICYYHTMTHLYTYRRYTSLAILIGLCTGIFAASSPLWWAYAASPFSTTFVNVEGIYGIPHSLWIFNLWWGEGNAGTVRLISTADETTLGGSWLYLDTSTVPQMMTDNLWLDSVGWVRMENTELIPPIGANVMTPWTLSGYAWSENAWYIDFDAEPTSYSWVAYIPGTKTLTGYAWSDTLWYISFQEAWLGAAFKNKVKILGNIGGSKSYDMEYALGTKFDTTNTAWVINSIRKNIAILTRSLPAGKMNTTPATSNKFNNILYYKIPSNSIVSGVNVKMNTNDSRSLIVEWGDIYIDTDIEKNLSVDLARSIISVKDTDGNGWNIYIKWDVKNIYASLVAEGSIYSWDPTASILYNDTTAKLTQLPKYQLYILGSVISRNTIGGSARTPVVCPFVEATCNYANSYKYDWNYFRTFDQTDVINNGSAKLWYPDYSVIIEYDSRLIWDPPPGIAN